MKYLRRWPVNGELYGVSVPARTAIVCWGYQAFRVILVNASYNLAEYESNTTTYGSNDFKIPLVLRQRQVHFLKNFNEPGIVK